MFKIPQRFYVILLSECTFVFEQLFKKKKKFQKNVRMEFELEWSWESELE